MHHPTVPAVITTLLAALPAVQAGLYPKSSPVLQLEGKDYDKLIAKSNYTSIVEFYAPWCGHCQNLKPAYEKAARNLEGLAKVAAVNCDDDANKPFCGSMGIQGFPTLKIVRPAVNGKKNAKPVVEDYQGPRTAAGIVEAVVDKINNHVKRVSDKDIDAFLKDKNDTAKALLFTEKGTTSALLKSIAIDFLGVITVGQVRNTATKAVEMFGIESYPTLVLLPGGDKDSIVYDGELKKEALVKFLSQAGSPNPDPSAAKPKKEKASSKSSKSKTKASTSTEAAEPSSEPENAGTDQAEEPIIQKPVILDVAPPIPIINTPEKLVKECLSPKSHTCVLAFVPSDHGEQAEKALSTLAELAFKHAQSKRHLFPFFEVHIEDAHAKDILTALDLKGDVQVLAVNARRNWWRHFEGADFGHEAIERWIDQIRLSEGTKKKLPEGIVAAAVEEETLFEATPEATSEPTPEATEEASTAEETPAVTPEAESESSSTKTSTPQSGADPTPDAKTGEEHDEL